MPRLAAIGECMIELCHRDERTLEMAFAGDTFNTALYLARLNAPHRLAVDYVTALGSDPYSDAMVSFWQEEGVGVGRVARLAGRLPGLYILRPAADGERHARYWRSAAAVRELFCDERTAPLLAALAEYDLLYFSAITLSVLAEPARRRFAAALAAARAAGRQVVFDSNYRPAGWSDAAAARSAILPFLDHVTLALPTFEDERALWGDAAPAATVARYAARGAEVAVKRGADGCILAAEGRTVAVPVPERITPLDATGAGDAFNAAYLTARLAGSAPEEAARAGHRLAGIVIRRRGAIIPSAAMPPLDRA